MTTTRLTSRNLVVAAVGGLAVLGSGAAAASATTPYQDVPAAGATVSCQATGALTGASGYLRQRESTWLDRRGRAHVLFTIHARRVELTAADGARYRLVGGGHDYVVYRDSDLTAGVQLEHEAFDFAVVGRHGRAGVVRFHLHTDRNGNPIVHDESTCQLPNMS